MVEVRLRVHLMEHLYFTIGETEAQRSQMTHFTLTEPGLGYNIININRSNCFTGIYLST